MLASLIKYFTPFVHDFELFRTSLLQNLEQISRISLKILNSFQKFSLPNLFYSEFFGEDPGNLPYSDDFGIDETTTRFIQQIAVQVVLANSEEWNLPLSDVP